MKPTVGQALAIVALICTILSLFTPVPLVVGVILCCIACLFGSK